MGVPRSLDLWLWIGCSGMTPEGKGRHLRCSRLDGAALVGGLEGHFRCATRGILGREEFSDSDGKHRDEIGVTHRVASGRPKVSLLQCR